jgi:methylenetetrahydrofolate dehydrogenase (NADP+) / methenyltetrahydrofolate cyclohydrolase
MSNMAARTLDGSALARQIKLELRDRVAAFTAAQQRPPGLGIVLVGDDPSSEIYVRGKLKSAGETGLRADLHRLPATASLDEVLALVHALNDSPDYDGILVQSPLPPALGRSAEPVVFDAVDPMKDVDGFHPENVGRLVQKRPYLVSCTPLGVMELLTRSGVAIDGAHAVVIGRSDIVGKPLALLLMHANATVTVCHSRTRGLAQVCATADILVAAIGRTAFVTPDFVKPGATVVDVGINRVADAATVTRLFSPESSRRADFERRGSIVVGDVHPAVWEVAGAMTPVPGGIGPLTIALLLSNTLKAAEARCSRSR